jgi:hypothetical protein
VIVSDPASRIRIVSSIEALEETFRSAQAALETYSREITAKYREQMPDPAGWRGPGPDPDTAVERAKAWTEQERAEYRRLDDAARQAAVEVARARQEAEGHTSGE